MTSSVYKNTSFIAKTEPKENMGSLLIFLQPSAIFFKKLKLPKAYKTLEVVDV